MFSVLIRNVLGLPVKAALAISGLTPENTAAKGLVAVWEQSGDGRRVIRWRRSSSRD